MLQYLDRVWAGERNSEDFYIRDASPSDRVASLENEVAQKLEGVLKREKPEALTDLEDTYGFGAPDTPSAFAIHMAGRLHFAEACRSLGRTHIDALQGPHYSNGIGKDYSTPPGLSSASVTNCSTAKSPC